jgi:sugar O-acyltransferase (sialic acid O-acetyltransferase NeuD family)
VNTILIGYSGHAFVAFSIFKEINKNVFAYCDASEKKNNPFNLIYLGDENSETASLELSNNKFFISIGNNAIRRNVFEKLAIKNLFPINAIHPSSIICSTLNKDFKGVLIGAGVIVNTLCKISNGVILNTGCIIEHESVIGDFSHICPGTILCGNVSVGFNTFVGAGSVIKHGVKIGNNVIVGAGSVVLNDIPDNSIVFGNPAKIQN